MALGKSIRMYLTIFVATTCIYMVLYQYHISGQPMTSADVLKNKDISVESTAGNGNKIFSSSSSSSSFVKRYNLFLWSPMYLLTQNQQQHRQQQQQQHEKQSPQSTALLTSATNQVNSVKAIELSSAAPFLSLSSSSSSSWIRPSSSSAELLQAAPNTSPSSSGGHKLLEIDVVPLDTPASIGSAEDHSNCVHHQHSHPHRIQNHHRSRYAYKSIHIGTNHTKTNPITPRNGSNSNLKRATMGTIALANLTSSNSLTTTPTTTTTGSAIARSAVAATTTSTAATTIVVPPPLYIITPTYRRPEQLAELTRLGYTLKHVMNLLWLVIEDANKTSELVTRTLNRIGVPYEYFVAPMPEEYKKTKKAKPRGVSNRNRGLEWLRENATEGVFYFADDDNTYDILIFEQMRYTKKVSMWPVGLVTKYGVSSPIIRNGTIDGFYDGWIGGRKYAVDMAGFAVSVKFLHERPKAKMPFKPGYEEDGFLKSLAPLNNSEIELLAFECTEILTWHTQTKKNPSAEKLNMTKYNNTNLVKIDKLLVRPGSA